MLTLTTKASPRPPRILPREGIPGHSTNLHEIKIVFRGERTTLFKTMVVTPEGSIIRFADKKMMPETDPDWEENVAMRKAKHQRVRQDARSSIPIFDGRRS